MALIHLSRMESGEPRRRKLSNGSRETEAFLRPERWMKRPGRSCCGGGYGRTLSARQPVAPLASRIGHQTEALPFGSSGPTDLLIGSAAEEAPSGRRGSEHTR